MFLLEWIFTRYITDPELAWVAYNRTGIGGTYGAYIHALLRRESPRVPREKTVSPIPIETTIAPDYGGISMRLPGTDRYCYMHFGRELTHGHRNKLSLNAYAHGHWFMRNVMGGYGDNFRDFLETSASASANSIMVDGMTADADTGELLYHASGDDAVVAAARERGAFEVPSLGRRSAGLLWRQTGSTVCFVASFLPYAETADGSASIDTIPVSDEAGKTLALEHGQAVRVTSSQGPIPCW